MENKINERKQKMWKVVNTFNGSVEGYVYTYEEGEALAEEIKKEYYAHPGRQNDILPLDIVPANSKWRWNEMDNRFEWDEGDTDYFVKYY